MKTGPGEKYSKVEASAVDEHGDLFFWKTNIVSFVIKRTLPDLQWCGLAREKRREWYAPSPNAWGRQSIEDGARVGVKLLVPRRYQWWARLVWRCELKNLIVALRREP